MTIRLRSAETILFRTSVRTKSSSGKGSAASSDVNHINPCVSAHLRKDFHPTVCPHYVRKTDSDEAPGPNLDLSAARLEVSRLGAG